MRWRPFELHPDTPAEGAPKPFTDEQWPAIRARLIGFAERIGIPIDPPRRNVNSRLALQIGELVRERKGDAVMAQFHHAVSRAFFVDQADIASVAVIAAQAETFGVDAASVREVWESQRFAPAIVDSMRASLAVGVTGVPAFGWHGDAAVSGMMEPVQIERILRARLGDDERARTL